MTVGQIFEQLGEPRFRDLETRLLDRLVSERAAAGGSSQPLVLATGGGMPVTPGNFERLEALGEVVALGADLDILAGRLLADGGRPLLAKGDDGDTRSGAELLKEKLERLIEPRAHVYARARYKLDTGGWTPEEIAEEVLKRLGLAS